MFLKSFISYCSQSNSLWRKYFQNPTVALYKECRLLIYQMLLQRVPFSLQESSNRRSILTFLHVYFQLKHEMSTIVNKILVNYTGHNKTSEHAWDYLQRTVSVSFSFCYCLPFPFFTAIFHHSLTVKLR